MAETSLPRLSAERLLSEFTAQLDEWDLWHTDPSEAFERTAQRFYDETGLLAPGKSLPLEMSSIDLDDERRQRYNEWGQVEREKRHQMLRQVAALLADATARQQEQAEPATGQMIVDFDAALTRGSSYYELRDRWQILRAALRVQIARPQETTEDARVDKGIGRRPTGSTASDNEVIR